jgi:transposase-like protein
MPEIDRLSGSTDWIDLDFVQRERTPEQIIEVGIQLHLAGLSLSNTKQYLEKLGVERSRTAIHNWVQRADVQPTGDAAPDHIAVDKTVIQVNDERHWLYASSIPRQINSSTFGFFRPERRNLSCYFSESFNSTYRSPKRRF